MSVTDQHLLDVLESFVGVTEKPANSNKVRFWRDIGMAHMLDDSVPSKRRYWCGAFTSAAYLVAGAELPRVDVDHGFVGCEAALEYARKHGELVPFAKGRPCDIVLMDAGLLEGKRATGRAGHVGIARAFAAGAALTTEGNTSAGAGSQSNGGIVAHKTRPSAVILGLWRPKGLVVPFTPTPAKPVAKPPAQLPHGIPFPGVPIGKGSPKPGAVRLVQHVVGAEPDGQFGDATAGAVRAWQRSHKLRVTGTVDRVTWAAMFPPTTKKAA